MSEIVEQVKAAVEVELEKQIEAHADELMMKAMEELKKLIPGQIDDMVIEGAKPILLPLIKEQTLKLVEMISERV